MLQVKYIIIGILLLGIVNAATYYVTDPDNCPSSDGTNFPGQNCAPQDICGDSSGIAQCYDTSTMNAPSASSTTTGSGGSDYSCSDATCSGGYVTNCYASIDSGAPYCDNNGAYLCDRNATCYNKHTQTTCQGGSFIASVCNATCTTGYVICDGSSGDADGCEVQSGVTSCSAGDNNNLDSSCVCQCDTGYTDCDSGGKNLTNGCEVYTSGTCTVGVLEGTYGGDCTCDISAQDIATTGTEVLWSGASPMLWMTLYSNSVGINMTFNYSQMAFIVNSSGAYWNNSDLSSIGTSGGGSGLAGAPPYLYNDSDNIYWNSTHGNATYCLIGSLVDYVGNWSDDKPDYYNASTSNATYVLVGGDAMTGALNLSNNNLESVSNISSTGDMILKFSGDTNSYLKLNMTGNLPYIVGIGTAGYTAIWLTDDSTYVGNVFYEDGNNYLDMYWHKTSDKFVINSMKALDIHTNNDIDDYIQFNTSGNIPLIKMVGGNALNITSATNDITLYLGSTKIISNSTELRIEYNSSVYSSASNLSAYSQFNGNYMKINDTGIYLQG